MTDIYYSAIGILAIVIHFIVNYMHYASPSQRQDLKDYKKFLNVIVLYYISDAAWGLINYKDHTNLLYADTILYYVFMALSVIYCCRYIITFLQLKSGTARIINAFGICFGGLVVTSLLVNHFHRIFFTFDEYGNYQALTWRYIVLSIQIFMFSAVSSISFYVAFKANKLSFNRNLAIALFGVCMLTALILQTLYPLLPLYAIGLMLGTLVIHVFIHYDDLNRQVRMVGKLNVQFQKDKEILHKQKEEVDTAFAIISGLNHDFQSIWWAKKEDMIIHLVSSTDSVNKGALQAAMESKNCDEAMRLYIKYYVAEQDQERLYREATSQEVLRRLEDTDFFAINYMRFNPHGEQVYNQVAFANADMSDGTHLLVFGFRDINYILQQEQELDKERTLRQQETQAKLAAEAANNAKTKFLQNMSHEIRTPLNALFGFAQLLGMPDGSCTEEEKTQYNAYIYNSYRMLEMLISDIIDIADSEHGNYRIEYSDVCVNSTCHNALMSVEYRVPASVRLYMTSDFPDDFHVRSDERRIQQVLINYLTNACKNTQEGEIHLHVSKSEHPGKVTFSVTDTGRGIPEEKASLIFQRFTKLHQEVQGSGLGLSICQVVAVKLGGSVYLDTAYKAGARFVFVIDAK